MGTQIFLVICGLAMGFLVYCLFHFVLESRMFKTPKRNVAVRAIVRDRQVLRFPERSDVNGQTVEVRRRA
jgi:hypothetical protein